MQVLGVYAHMQVLGCSAITIRTKVITFHVRAFTVSRQHAVHKL